MIVKRGPQQAVWVYVPTIVEMLATEIAKRPGSPGRSDVLVDLLARGLVLAERRAA